MNSMRCFAFALRRRLAGNAREPCRVAPWLVPALLGLALAADGRPIPTPGTPQGAGAATPAAAPAPSVLAEAPTAVVAQQGPVTLEQAIAMARERHEGRVARAETVRRGNRRVHEITILADGGRARRVRIDAETGRFLGGRDR